MRNSSLVEGSRAENVTGLKPAAEAVDAVGTGWKVWRWKAKPKAQLPSGRAAGGDAGRQRAGSSEFCRRVVGERSSGDEGESRGLLERGEVRIPE